MLAGHELHNCSLQETLNDPAGSYLSEQHDILDFSIHRSYICYEMFFVISVVSRSYTESVL